MCGSEVRVRVCGRAITDGISPVWALLCRYVRGVLWISTVLWATSVCGLVTHCLGQTLRLDVVDVGQGDAVLVSCPDGVTFSLIDAGDAHEGYPGAEEKLRSCVRERMGRHRQFHVAVSTHPHPDHISGFLPLFFSGYSPKVFIESGADFPQGDDEEKIRKWLGHRRIPVRRVASGELDLCGSAEVVTSILALNEDEQRALGCPENLNDCSIKLRISFAGYSALLLADATQKWEAVALQRPELISQLSADVLKVGHHASRVSSSRAFLKVVRPKFAVVSAGNPGTGRVDELGYPDRSTLERLSEALGGIGDSEAAPVLGCVRHDFAATSSCRWSKTPRNANLFVTSTDGTVSIEMSSSGLRITGRSRQ